MVDPSHSPPEPATAGARIAAIDVGSNSIRLVVAEVLPSGGYRVLDEERENTRLAAALIDTGRLDRGGVEATVAVLQLPVDRRRATASTARARSAPARCATPKTAPSSAIAFARN